MSPARRVVLSLLTCACCCPASLYAQRVLSSIDLAGTTVSYADSVHEAGASIAPAVRADWARATLDANAELSGLGGKNVSTQGTLAPSLFTPSIGQGRFAAELAGSLGGSTHEDGTKTGRVAGVVRGYMMGVSQGLWIGGGGGETWDGSIWRAERQLELGGWFSHGGATTLATVTPVAVGDSTRYTDFQIALRYPGRAYELGLSAGARAGDTGPEIGGTSRAWGSVSVLSWLSQTVAVVASAGTYPVDLTQGFPGGRFATLGLRLASRNTRATEREETRAVNGSSPTSESPVLAFGLESLGNDRRVLRVRAPQATRVEISGDFTHWQPVALSRAGDGSWTTTQVIAPGSYQMNVRIDGGPWIAPPGLLTTRDEFGGVTGILTVE